MFVVSVVIVLSTLNPYLITYRLYIYLASHIRYLLDYLYVNNNYLFLSLFILSTVFMLDNWKCFCCVYVGSGGYHVNMAEGGSGPPHPQNEIGVLGPQDDQAQEKHKSEKYNKQGDVRDVSVQSVQSNRMVYPSGQNSPITRPTPAAVANSSANMQKGTHYTSSSSEFPMTRSGPLQIANPTVDIRNGNIHANISANSAQLSQGSPARH